MGFITRNDANVLACYDDDTRVEVLYAYLVLEIKQEDIGRDILGNYSTQPGQPVSCITRAFGFSGRGNCGAYKQVPRWVVERFVAKYCPEDYESGLEEGTFDLFLRECRQEMDRQRQQQKAQEERARRAQEAQAALERQQAAQRAEQQRQYEQAQRRRKEEQARQEAQRRAQEEARQAEERRQEARRQEKISQGTHIDLMDQAFAALERGDFVRARWHAQEAEKLQPMVGSTQVLALCEAHDQNWNEAVQYAQLALKHITASDNYYLEMCNIVLAHGSYDSRRGLGIRLWNEGKLEGLSDQALLGLVMRASLSDDPPEGFLRDLVSLIQSGPGYDACPVDKLAIVAAVLTQQADYDLAYEVYQAVLPRQNELQYHERREYINPFLGKCCYERGDRADALCFLAGSISGISQPVDWVVYWGYADELRDVARGFQGVEQAIRRAQDYLSGKMSATEYFHCSVNDLASFLGVRFSDYIWTYDQALDSWSLTPYSPTALDEGKRFFRGLFGK